MKKIISALLITLISSCINKNDLIILKGISLGKHIDSIQILDKNYTSVHTIKLSEDSLFNDTLFVPQGYYYLSVNKINKPIFLNPGVNLNTQIQLDSNTLSISFQGNGSKENNYLFEKGTLNQSLKKIENPKYYLRLKIDSFIKLSDSIYNKKIDFLNRFVNLNKDFKNLELFSIEFDKALLHQRYINRNKSTIDDINFDFPKNFQNPYININLSDEKLLIHPKFTRCVKESLSFNNIDKTSNDQILTKLIHLDKEIESKKIKNEIAYETMKFGIFKTKMLDSLYAKYLSINTSKIYKSEIEKIYLNLKKISKGSISPTFKLYDINNKLVTLEDLKGKLIYIDVWATWCIPCIKEIPALKNLQQEFENKSIYFVSICVGDTKERFEKMVKNENLSGIQLFAPNDTILFFKEYFLTGIPRFILIDYDGKIIDANAYKPSNSKLKKQISKYLTKV